MTYCLFAIYEELLVYTLINLYPHLVCITDIIVNINALQFQIPYRITVLNDIVYLFTEKRQRRRNALSWVHTTTFRPTFGQTSISASKSC